MGDATVKMVPESRIIGDGTSAGPAADCKVAEYLIEALADAGVRYIFGVVGGTVFPLFTATVGRQAQIVMTKHEAGAAFMADGYARASGGLGACVATSGPGATNLITGVAAAYADSIPIVVLTGQVATKSFGRGALQESSSEGVDIVDVFKQVTRYSILVVQGGSASRHLAQGAAHGAGGRPGPVHLSLPADVQEQMIQRPVEDDRAVHPGRDLRPGGDQAGGAAPAPSAAAGDPRRARRHPVERVRRDPRHRRDAGDPRRDDPEGEGRVPGGPSALGGAFRVLGVAAGAVASPGERRRRPARRGDEPQRVGHAGVGSPAPAERGPAARRHRPVRDRQELPGHRAR